MDYNEEQQVITDPIDTLYKVVSEKGLYSKSIDEFKKQYSTPDQIDKLYQVVKDQGLYSKSKEEFSGKYFSSASSIPKLDYRAPVQQSAPKETAAIPQPNLPKVVPTETTADQFTKKHIEAQNTLHQELTGNNELIPDLIKKQKSSAQADQNLTNFAQQPRSDQPQTATQQLASSLLPKPPEPTIEPQEVGDFMQRVQADPTAGRAFLQHVAQIKPDKAKTIQSAMYVNDAMNRLSQGPDSNAGDTEGKVVRNAQDIEKGKLNYSVQGGLLTKPEDAWQSIATGLQQKRKAFADYDLFNKATPDEAISELEKRRAEHDPDEPTPVPKGFSAELAGGMAEQPFLGLAAGKVAGGATALIPGAEGYAPAVDKLVSAAVSSNDFRKMSYAHSLQQNYNQLRNEGMDPQAAYEKANGQAKDEAAVDAIGGAAMMLGAGSIGEMKLPSFNLSEGFKSAVVNGLKQGAKGIGEAGAVGLIQGAGQDIKNKLAEDKGIQRSGSGEDIKDAVESGTLFTLGMAAIAKGGSLLSAKTRSQILQGLSKATPEQVDTELGSQVMEKHITPEEAIQAKKDIEEHRILDTGIPDNVTEESRMKIQEKIKRRNYLETQLESSDAAFHPEIKEKIKAVNEDILELAKDKIPRGEEQGIQAATPEELSTNKPSEQAASELNEQGANSENGNSVPRGTLEVGMPVQSDHFEGERNIIHVAEDGSHVVVESPEGDHVKHEIPVEDIKPKEAEPEMTGITHAQTDETAKQLGLETYEKKPETVAEWDAEADKRLREDPQTIPKLLKKLENGHEPDKIDQRVMVRHLSSLKARIEENPSNELLAEYKHAKDLSDIMGGREVAKSLVARRGSVPVKDSLADYLIQDMDAAGVDDLTDNQKAKTKEDFDSIQKAQEAYESKIKDLEDENTRLKADAELKKAKGSTPKNTKKTHSDFVSERKSYVDKLKELKEKHEQDLRDRGIQKMGAGFTFTADMAKVVGQIVKSLVEEGMDKLEDVVKNVHEQLKDIFPGIEEKDVHNIIAGEYNEKNKTKNELAEKLRDLKTQAKLINKLESLQNGEEPKSEKNKIERNKEIAALKKEIKEHDLTKLAQSKKSIQSQIDKVQDDLAKGKYEPEAKKEPLKLDKEAQELKDKLNKLRQDREVGLLKQQYAQRSKIKKTLDVIAEVGNTPRALMSSLDFSAPLRQGLFGVTKQLFSHPGDLGRQFSIMFKFSGSQKLFDRWFADLKEAPDYEIMKKSGLPISDPHDPKLTAKEEAFMSNYAEKIPLGVGKAIKASERAYVGFLNKMRVDIFRRGVDGFAANGKTFDNSPELYKAWGDYVGAATGRGKMPEILEKSSPILSAAFFSPRLIASRLNLLTNWANPGFYAKVPKEIRIQYFKDMAKFIGTGVLVLGLAKAAGAEVETDPRSSDFGKIKVGNTRWDIWGGFQQYVRLAAQLITGEKKSTTNDSISELNDPNNSRSKTRADVLFQFARGKLSPLPAEVVDLMAGKDVTGKPADFSSELMKNMPLVLGDIMDAYKDKGVQGALGVGIPSMFGVGVQTYGAPMMNGGSGGGSGASGSYNIKEWQ